MAEENISAAGAAEIDTLNININVESGGSLAELDRFLQKLDSIHKKMDSMKKDFSNFGKSLEGAVSGRSRSSGRTANSNVGHSISFGSIDAITKQYTDLGYEVEQVSRSVSRLNRGGTKISDTFQVVTENDITTLKSVNGQVVSLTSKIVEAKEKLSDPSLGAWASFQTYFEDTGTQIKKVSENVTALAGGSQKVVEVFDVIGDNGKKTFTVLDGEVIKITDRVEELGEKTKKTTSFLNTFANISAAIISAKFIVGTLRDFIEESSSYVENMNLFTIAMGEYAEEATAYAETVQDALGLDISEWIRAQGLLMQLATGFGVAREDAAAMSKTLTQLSYDISSYFNISTDEALTKVRSGISGEIEPMRNLGYALDEATLKRVAYDHGIEKSIESMTQAEKAQLRFIAIMEQSGNVMGDLSRTLESPANQLRIIDQEIMQLKRSVGNFLIPMMQVALPLITAIVDELTELSNKLADFLGYEMPTFDYSNLQNAGNASGELADGLTDATTAAKKLNSALIGIDELNVLREDAGISSALTGGPDLGIDFSQYDYDFLGNASEEARKASEEMEELAKAILFVAAAFLAVKTGMTAYNFGTALAAMASTPVGAIVLATSALVLLSAAVAMHDEEINDFVDNTGKKLTDFFDSSVKKIDEWSDSWTDVVTSDSLENYVSRILKWLSALTEGASDYIQNTVDSIDAIFEGDLMRVGRNTLKNLALLGVSILETITAPIRLILDGINEVADDLNGWFERFGWDFRLGEIPTDWFSGMREGLRNWGVSDIPTEKQLQKDYFAEGDPFFPGETAGQYYQHIITSSNGGMNMAVKEQTALLLSEAEKIAGLLQENLEKEVSIVIGDEVIGRSNDRYQSTYGEKLNSGSYDGGY